MSKTRAVLAVLGFAAAAAAGPAMADDKGIYLGGSVGYAQYKDGCDAVVAATGCQDHDEAWRAFAGYRFSRNMAAELGFANLGKLTADASGQRVEVERRTWDLSVVMSFPITERLSAFGRLGGYRARTTSEVTTGAGTLTSGESDSGITYGAGLGYQLGFLGVRAEWQRYGSVGGSTTNEDTIDVFSLGALIQF